MTDIQQARDVLAKWREHPFVRDDWFERAADKREWGVLTSLIVGTAGNPGLLDAIDGLLAVADGPGTAFTDQRVAAERIAAAIIAADERMGA